MKTIKVVLQTDDKSIDYIIDLEDNKFESGITLSGENRELVQASNLIDDDSGRKDLALRIYHIILAAMRNK